LREPKHSWTDSVKHSHTVWYVAVRTHIARNMFPTSVVERRCWADIMACSYTRHLVFESGLRERYCSRVTPQSFQLTPK
jgi:hypothetical protein